MHSKEPWYVTETPPNGILKNNEAISVENDKWDICAVWRDAGQLNEPEANARRIVACVNACAGIPTETLESAATSIPSKSSLNGYLEIKQQRDEMLAALKQIADDGFENSRDRRTIIAKTAIAKADLTE